uniref:Uncharacterized protein n=1 Tax=Oryza glumipatula TaxID=40148 RepID=A0A0D9Y4R8_9ORYZ
MVAPSWASHNYSHTSSSSSSLGLSPSLHLSFSLPATEREWRAAAPTGEEGAAHALRRNQPPGALPPIQPPLRRRPRRPLLPPPTSAPSISRVIVVGGGAAALLAPEVVDPEQAAGAQHPVDVVPEELQRRLRDHPPVHGVARPHQVHGVVPDREPLL